MRIDFNTKFELETFEIDPQSPETWPEPGIYVPINKVYPSQRDFIFYINNAEYGDGRSEIIFICDNGRINKCNWGGFEGIKFKKVDRIEIALESE